MSRKTTLNVHSLPLVHKAREDENFLSVGKAICSNHHKKIMITQAEKQKWNG
jgi:hypothetical protein